ncbi:MAG: GNAT family N-acetyltransferase [Rhizobiales bacterium]|nr:GNAT family N-acetyltransferase [Hyphomicrobiales bacterium]
MLHETSRLLCRSPRLADAPDLWRILGDEAARPYTFKTTSLRDTRRHIAGNECQRRKVGFGPWTVIEKASGSIVGFGGLYEDPFFPGWGPEVGYHFAPGIWRRGYATELTIYALQYAHESRGIAEVIAFAHPDNLASQRVLQKTGFAFERFVDHLCRYQYVHRVASSDHGL